MSSRNKLLVDQMRIQQSIINVIQENNQLIDKLERSVAKTNKQNDLCILVLIATFLVIVTNQIVLYYR
jgi:hypothetical protein